MIGVFTTDNGCFSLNTHQKKKKRGSQKSFDNGLCAQLGLLALACLGNLCVQSCVHGDDPASAPLECLQCAQIRREISSSTWFALRPAVACRTVCAVHTNTEPDLIRGKA